MFIICIFAILMERIHRAKSSPLKSYTQKIKALQMPRFSNQIDSTYTPISSHVHCLAFNTISETSQIEKTQLHFIDIYTLM